MAVEILEPIGVINYLLPLLAITALQAKAIFNRDNHGCVFPFEHECKGKLSIHHIDGKEDSPNNLGSVCHTAHWKYLHNGAGKEEQLIWQMELTKIASEHTEEAVSRGWRFPEK
ncbi:MAG: hypothetical protein ABII80_02480 [bacterium]